MGEARRANDVHVRVLVEPSTTPRSRVQALPSVNFAVSVGVPCYTRRCLGQGSAFAAVGAASGHRDRDSSVEVERIYAIEVGAIVERQGLLPRPPWRPARRRPRGQPEVIEHSTGNSFVLDKSDYTHRPLTPRADKNVHAPGAFQQGRPGQPATAAEIVGWTWII